jgi:hypothetical protein
MDKMGEMEVTKGPRTTEGDRVAGRIEREEGATGTW